MATECAVPALGAGASLRTLTPSALASSVKMIWSDVVTHVIARVLLANDVHGQAKFVAVVGFSHGFDVG